MGTALSKLLSDIYANYAEWIELDTQPRYIGGAPLRPVVPLDTGRKGVFFLGAYPSARFAVVNGITDVPIADNLGPFEPERWFDGARVREQASARELHELFLKPLALPRASCWITDLVKVFLFKKGHVERYRRLGAEAPAGYRRTKFEDIAAKSIPCLERELLAAEPVLLVTLGAEVAGVLRGVSSRHEQLDQLNPEVSDLTVGRTTWPAIHCPHPGILMRPGTQNTWPEKLKTDFLPKVQNFLAHADGCSDSWSSTPQSGISLNPFPP